MPPAEHRRIALLYPGDRADRDRADPAASRFEPLFRALAEAGLAPEPAVWHDEWADEVAAQLAQVDAVLAWCNPIEGGRRRDRLDAVLRTAAAQGVRVSAHPEAVWRLGTKDVLYATRELPFGSDVHRVDSLDELDDPAGPLLARLAHGPRVLKQHRGHSGIGVWRVETAGPGLMKVRPAQRGAQEQLLGLPQLKALLAPCFLPEAGGHLIDQAWQPGVADGMLRAYLVGGRVGGFGAQAINALHPEHPHPGPRLYHDADWPPGQALRQRLEGGWVDQLCQCVGLPRAHLPLLWDADFMPAQPGSGLDGRLVLCEINVSSVSPFPPSCIGLLVNALPQWLKGGSALP